jgi:hypothetical protein
MSLTGLDAFDKPLREPCDEICAELRKTDQNHIVARAEFVGSSAR